MPNLKTKIIILTFFLLGCTGAIFAADAWNEYKQDHFIIFYKEAPLDFVKSVAVSAEDYYGEIARNLGYTRYKGWTWDERAKIYIYDNTNDYVQSASAAQWSHGIASPQSKIIRTFPAAHGFFDSTLPHEIGHIVFREFVGFKADVPLWFEEGIAMYQEKAKRWGAHEAVRRAIENGSFIPLDELSVTILKNNSDKEKVNLFYAEAASAVNYLINEQGQSRFVRFCRKLEEGKPFDWALNSVYVRFKNTKDLNRAWVDYLTK